MSIAKLGHVKDTGAQLFGQSSDNIFVSELGQKELTEVEWSN